MLTQRLKEALMLVEFAYWITSLWALPPELVSFAEKDWLVLEFPPIFFIQHDLKHHIKISLAFTLISHSVQ